MKYIPFSVALTWVFFALGVFCFAISDAAPASLPQSLAALPIVLYSVLAVVGISSAVKIYRASASVSTPKNTIQKNKLLPSAPAALKMSPQQKAVVAYIIFMVVGFGAVASFYLLNDPTATNVFGFMITLIASVGALAAGLAIISTEKRNI